MAKLENKEQTVFVGRRKTAVVRVRIIPGNGKIIINKRPYVEYFPILRHQLEIKKPLLLTNNIDKFDVFVNAKGGGITGQCEAIKLGIARALLKTNEELTTTLRKFNLLTRDPREKERKKYGRKRARRRFQYSKR